MICSIHILLTLALVTVLAPAAPETYVDTAFKKSPVAACLQARALKEASGLASMVHDAEFLWLINDSGGEPVVYLAGTNGKDRGKARVEGAKNTDWEDIASFSWKGKPYLIIADTGDNNARRDSCMLYIIPEPALPPGGKPLDASVKPEWTIAFRYPDGPRDCEALAVDADHEKILLISKRTSPPMVYELPLTPGKPGVIVAEKAGRTDVSPPPDSPFCFFAAQPTGMDISPDGTMAAVVTYVSVFIFPKTPKESWAQAFARKPVMLERHGLRQTESIAFSRDGKTLFCVSEGALSPIISYGR
jgi:hypothetical protein